MKYISFLLSMFFLVLLLSACTENGRNKITLSSEENRDEQEQQRFDKDYYEASLKERAPFVNTELNWVKFAESATWGWRWAVSSYKLIRNIGTPKSQKIEDIVNLIPWKGEEKKDCSILQVAKVLPWKNPKNLIYYELSWEKILEIPEKWEYGYRCGPVIVGPSAPMQYLVYSPVSKKVIYIDLSQDPYVFDPATLDF